MGRQPRARQQERRPPRIRREHNGQREPPDHLDQARGDEVHAQRERWPGDPQVELAGHGEVVGERGVLEMAHAGWPHACLGEPIVEPGGGAIAEVGANHGMDRGEHLEQHEPRAGEGERRRQIIMALDRANEHAHGDGEGRRQHSAQGQHEPPRACEGAIGLREDAEELPLFPIAYAADSHACSHGSCPLQHVCQCEGNPTGSPLRTRLVAARVALRTSDPTGGGMDAVLSEKYTQLGRMFLDMAHVVELQL